MSDNRSLPRQVDHHPGNSRQLTERELEVISLLVRGISNSEIAAELGLSERTIYDHIRNIKDKLDLVSRSDLLRYVREHGLK
jgi:DNA-binding CsgD family transcriptional regulator